MQKITVRIAPTRIIRFVDAFGKRRIFIRGIGSFPEESVKIDFDTQKKLTEFADRYYKVGW